MGSISLKYKSKSGNLTAPGDVDPGAMIPIATSTVGSGGGTISFSNIPQNYEHLQLRILAQPYYASTSAGNITARFNSDSGANYTRYGIYADGSTAGYSYTGYTYAAIDRFYYAPSGSIFSAVIVDILDYSNTNKYKTIRALGGYNTGSVGDIRTNASLWSSTAAITSISFSDTLNQNSTIALYGIKRAGA